MASSGVRERASDSRRIRKSILDREEDIVDEYKVWDETTALSSLAGGGTPDRGQGSPEGNFMARGDDTWSGPHGNELSIVTITNGEINASNSSGADASIIGVNPEGGTADFLDWIIPGSDVLIYQEEWIQTFVENITFRPVLTLEITNIVGINTITVTLADGSALATNDKVVVVSPSGNFNSDVVPITKTGANTFTYSGAGSVSADTTGSVVRGNILPPDNSDYLSQPNTISQWLFDAVTLQWRWVGASNASTTVSEGANATLRLSSNLASVGVVTWNSNVISGSKITDEGSGVFKLSNGVFILVSHIRTTSSGNTGSIDIKWQTATDAAFTTPVNVGTIGTIFPPSQTSNLSSLPFCTATIDATSADVFVRVFTDNQTAFTNILSASSVGLITSLAGGGSGGGSGDLSFPINFPTKDLGTIGGGTTNFSWLGQDRHAQKATLNGNQTISIGTDLPINTLGLTIFKLKQDGTGGRVVTFSGIENTSPTIDQTAGNTTYIGVQRMDGESLAFTIGDKIFVGSTADLWSEFPATQAVDMANNQFFNYLGWTAAGGATSLVNTSGLTNSVPANAVFDFKVNTLSQLTISEENIDVKFNPLLNVTAIAIVDTGTNPRGSLSGDAGIAAMRLSTAVGGKFVISDVITNIVEFDDATGLKMVGTHDIDLNNRDITNVDDIFVDQVRLQSGSIVTNKPMITSVGGNSVDINHPTGSSVNFTEQGGTAAVIIDGGGLITSNNMILQNTLTFNDHAADPLSNGQFTRNGADMKVFSGGGVKNFSNIPPAIPATRELDNLTTTAINAVLLPGVTNAVDLGSELLAWRIAHFRDYEITTASSGPNSLTDTQISREEIGSGSTKVNTVHFNVQKETASTLPGEFRFNFDGASGARLTRNTAGENRFDVDILEANNHLQLQSQAVNPAINGIMANLSGFIKLFGNAFEIRNTTTGASGTANFVSYRNDASSSSGDELGSLRFDGNDSSDAQTQYARILGGIQTRGDSGILALQVRTNDTGLETGIQLDGDNNEAIIRMNVSARITSDLRFEEVGSIPKIQPIIGQLAIVVGDNSSFTPGSLGTLAPPFTNSEPTSDADADAKFGNHEGAIGISRQTEITASHKQWSRDDLGKWGFVNVPNAF